jgi:hypothetical protein
MGIELINKWTSTNKEWGFGYDKNGNLYCRHIPCQTTCSNPIILISKYKNIIVKQFICPVCNKQIKV